MSRPRVSAFLGLSLDGFIARKDGGLDFLTSMDTQPPEDTGYQAFLASVDVVILGRGTYDVVRTFATWYYGDKRVIVLTTRPAEAHHGETFHSGSLLELLARLGTEGVQHVYLDGGATIRQGLRDGVVDEITLTWVPWIIGSGIPLFDHTLPDTRLDPKSSHTFPSGLVQVLYTVRRTQT
jgi:dihydrofolate reductase